VVTYDCVSYKSESVGGGESLIVHSLVPISPVLNYIELKKVLSNFEMGSYSPFMLALKYYVFYKFIL